MPSAKKAKKDAKEAGGVVAAVTKHASGKFTNGNTLGPASDTSSSASANQSPNVEPVTTPSSNSNPSVSPILGAVPSSGGPSFAPSPRAIPGMSDWAQSRAGGLSAGLAGSPGHLINLMGESPPSRWSSPRPYGTSHTSHTSHLSLASHGSHGSHPTSVSVSPPMAGELHGMARQRPLSYHMDSAAHYSPMSQPSPQHLPTHLATSPGHRRDSLHSHYAQSRGVAAATANAIPNPPPPHQPQAHFYGAPDLDLDMQPRQTGMKAGQRGYHFAFDTLPSPHHQGGSAETVVTAGYEGGLEAHSVSKRGLERLASLSGLRGGVVSAKILPWTATNQVLADAFPLIAVVVHGPVLPPAAPYPDAGESGANGAQDGGLKNGRASDGNSVAAEGFESGPQNSPQVDAREFSSGRTVSGSALPIEYYQTTVEIYSLKLNRHVCTLLEAPKIPLKIAVTSPIFQAPPPSGAFHIKADAGNIVISSAVTGECWLYRQMAFPGENDLPFVFVAKLWTTLQQSLKGINDGDAAADSERSRATSSASTASPRPGLKQPVFSLSGKWLAYCPATPSSQIALRAVVPVPIHGRAPGYNSMTPPHLPPTTADVDLPHTESVMNKIMRDATQELISGAKWVGQQGWQAFNNYWKGNPGASTPQAPRSPPTAGYAGRLDGQFPPTHGVAPPAAVVSKEPGLVSVVDITAVGNSTTIHPVTTFAPTLGCSFLSFSPTGLWLFTASTKGDVQTVWDLFRIQYTKASPLQAVSLPGTLTGPRVRQIAQFSRMTVARIVDVAWTRPNGERLAMVTERGTVHLLDLPSSAFTWPPPRRRGTRPTDAPGAAGTGAAGADAAGAGKASTAVSYASNAFSTAFDAARPLLTRPRRSSSNVPQSTGAIIVDHASHGGKIIAAGISHSLGKTGNAINQLRHTGENRVSLPSGPFAPGPSCVAWVAGKRHHSLFVLGDGLVRNFVSRTRKKSSGQRVIHLGFNKDLRVPSLPDDLLSTAVQHYLDPEVFLDFVEQNDAGSNTMVLATHMRRPSADPSAVESSIPHAEIESSAPYQPFHTDRRIALYEYDPLRQGALGAQSTLIYPSTLASQEPPTSEFSAMTISPPTQQPLSASPIDDDLLTTAPSANGKSKSAKKQAKLAAKAKEYEQTLESAPAPAPVRAFTDIPDFGSGNGSGNGNARGASPAPAKPNTSWVFGLPIVSTLVDTGFPPVSEEESFNISYEDTRALPASAIERVLEQIGGDEQIVVTTRRRRGGGRGGASGDPDDEDGFFEDDCEVLDFADQRV